MLVFSGYFDISFRADNVISLFKPRDIKFYKTCEKIKVF
jgi:hypothetical protein